MLGAGGRVGESVMQNHSEARNLGFSFTLDSWLCEVIHSFTLPEHLGTQRDQG